jgi:hypothetical protein
MMSAHPVGIPEYAPDDVQSFDGWPVSGDNAFMQSRPPESSYDPELIQRSAASEADRRQFWFKPWIASSGMSPEQLAAHVRSALDAVGTWTDYCELRMGGGPTARIDVVEHKGEVSFQATGGIGLAITAKYQTLEDALDMVQLFARLSWDVAQAAADHPFISDTDSAL